LDAATGGNVARWQSTIGIAKMRPVLFEIGDFAVPSFWAMAFLGFVVAFWVVRADLIRRGIPIVFAYDLVLYTYMGGWVGARLFLIPTGWDYFVRDPFAFLLSGSGWVWYGGVIGGTVAAAILCRSRGRSLIAVSDIAAPALAIGLAIGRIGCQLSGDGDYGVPTDLPWAMAYPEGVVPTLERVHPTPIYEMIACFGIFAYLWDRYRPSLNDGDLFGRYLFLSGLVRFLIEFVRRNPAWLIGLTTAQWISLGCIVGGALLARRASATPRPVDAESADIAVSADHV
jgi:phosphatidylglycerol:prolipoprotein diacylglycerol transferase